MKILILIGILLPILNFAIASEEITLEKEVITNEIEQTLRSSQINFGLGSTQFTGNRGAAYTKHSTGVHLSGVKFINTRTALTFGLEYSKHNMFIDSYVTGSDSQIIGNVSTELYTPFFGFKHYFDTSNLGKIGAVLNPYFVGRFEYWMQENSFPENENFKNESGSGIGSGFGLGLQIPVVKNESSIGFEAMYHYVNFFDQNTQDYRQITDETHDQGNFPSTEGYDDLNGNVITMYLSYNIAV